LGGLWALEWAWHSAQTCAAQELSYSFRDLSVHTDRRTDGHGYIDSASDPDQEYIYFMRSETLPSACYILRLI